MAPLLPVRECGQGGRPPRDPSPIVGAAWRDLPAVYGAWISPYRYYDRWTAFGLWPRILRAFQEDEEDV